MALRRQRLTRKGRRFIKVQEGVRRYAYNDSRNNATFGIGHLIHLGPVNAEDRRKWGTPANPKSMAFVWWVFRKDVRKYERAVREAVGRRLLPHRFDACVSLCLNIGTGGFASSTVARELREQRGDYVRDAANAFLLWDNPPELRPRRERERRLFLYGHYS